MPPSVQQPKLLVSFSGSRPPKISVSITINHLVNFGLINVDTDSLKIFVQSHYPFWIIHNFASEIFFLLLYPMKMTSNETYFALLNSIIAEDVDAYVHLSKYIKTVVNLRRNLSIHPHWFDSSKTVSEIQVWSNNFFREVIDISLESKRSCLIALVVELLWEERNFRKNIGKKSSSIYGQFLCNQCSYVLMW